MGRIHIPSNPVDSWYWFFDWRWSNAGWTFHFVKMWRESLYGLAISGPVASWSVITWLRVSSHGQGGRVSRKTNESPNVKYLICTMLGLLNAFNIVGESLLPFCLKHFLLISIDWLLHQSTDETTYLCLYLPRTYICCKKLQNDVECEWRTWMKNRVNYNHCRCPWRKIYMLISQEPRSEDQSNREPVDSDGKEKGA